MHRNSCDIPDFSFFGIRSVDHSTNYFSSKYSFHTSLHSFLHYITSIHSFYHALTFFPSSLGKARTGGNSAFSTFHSSSHPSSYDLRRALLRSISDSINRSFRTLLAYSSHDEVGHIHFRQRPTFHSRCNVSFWFYIISLLPFTVIICPMSGWLWSQFMCI